MAEATKVKTCDDGCDHEEHDNKSESESDDYEPTKDELIDMLEDVKEHLTLREGNAKTWARNSKPLSNPLMSSMHLIRG
jgi:hypothetical protein